MRPLVDVICVVALCLPLLAITDPAHAKTPLSGVHHGWPAH